MGTEKKENLEEMFDRLDQVIGTLEGEDVSLEEAFGLYDQGMKLIRRCNQTINEVEKKILVLDENGEKCSFGAVHQGKDRAPQDRIGLICSAEQNEQIFQFSRTFFL